MSNLYNNLFTYKPSKEKSSAENFITEAYVLLLQFSLENKTGFIQHFFNLLKDDVVEDGRSRIKISTQKSFNTSLKRRAIPDITIQTEKEYIFIEVKYGADINTYQVSEEDQTLIDQVKLYQEIELPAGISRRLYTLVLRKSEHDFTNGSPDFKKEIFWYDIHRMIKNYKSDNEIESYLLNQFKIFMENNYMSIDKVSYEFKPGMKSLLALINQMETALTELSIQYKSSYSYNWFGYSLFNSSNKEPNFGFLVNYWDPEKIVFEFNNESAQVKIKQQHLDSEFVSDPENHALNNTFNFENEHYFCLKPEEQLEKLKAWIKRNFDLLVEVSSNELT